MNRGGPTNFDVIVLGLGAMGSAALYHLARRGLAVCGVDQFAPGHDRGSSHGEVRVIRKAYHEHPDYIPLIHRAYELWESLNAQSAEALFVRCGLIAAGPRGSETIRGLELCYGTHDLPHERLDAAQVPARFPQFHLPRDYAAYYDPEAGYVFVERSVRRLVALAGHHGAEVIADARVTGWESDGARVEVRGEEGVLTSDTLVITAGAWSSELLCDLGMHLEVRRKVQCWYESANVDEFAAGRFPIFLIENHEGVFYGFPSINGAGVKAAEHSGGNAVADPRHVDRTYYPEDDAALKRCLRAVFPALEPALSRYSVCLYTMSPDGNFIIDTHPRYENVVFGAGFSGHGFKFAPVVGEILADLAQVGRTPHPIDFLRLGRFATAR